MKAVLLKEYGGIDGIVFEEIPVPQIATNEVLVRVETASVNPLDVKLISGNLKEYFPLILPYTLGTDLAGRVSRVGGLVSRWKEGDRVIARLEPGAGLGHAFGRGGAFAEYVAVPAHQLAPAPVEVNTSAGLPTAAATAWQALFEIAGIRAGHRVLIHAGAGGVGSFAIQLAKHAGAHVTTTAAADDLKLLGTLGADETVDYHTTDFRQVTKDIDVVLDTVGGDTQNDSYSVLRPGGMLISLVSPPDKQTADKHQVTGLWFSHSSDGARLGLLSALCDSKDLNVVVDRVFPFAETKDALIHSASGHAKGKILIRMK